MAFKLYEIDIQVLASISFHSVDYSLPWEPDNPLIQIKYIQLGSEIWTSPVFYGQIVLWLIHTILSGIQMVHPMTQRILSELQTLKSPVFGRLLYDHLTFKLQSRNRFFKDSLV